MFDSILSLIYRSHLSKGRQRSIWIEQYLYNQKKILSTDVVKDENSLYCDFFSGTNLIQVETLYLKLLREMKGVSYKDSEDVIFALSFLQEIISTALWKYHITISEKIEDFARGFDRLDVESEKIRLHEYAQIS